MNLISCDVCAIVLDKDKLAFPKDLYDEDGSGIDLDKAEYVCGRFEPFVPCPVCGTPIYASTEGQEI